MRRSNAFKPRCGMCLTHASSSLLNLRHLILLATRSVKKNKMGRGISFRSHRTQSGGVRQFTVPSESIALTRKCTSRACPALWPRRLLTPVQAAAQQLMENQPPRLAICRVCRCLPARSYHQHPLTISSPGHGGVRTSVRVCLVETRSRSRNSSRSHCRLRQR